MPPAARPAAAGPFVDGAAESGRRGSGAAAACGGRGPGPPAGAACGATHHPEDPPPLGELLAAGSGNTPARDACQWWSLIAGVRRARPDRLQDSVALPGGEAVGREAALVEPARERVGPEVLVDDQEAAAVRL